MVFCRVLFLLGLFVVSLTFQSEPAFAQASIVYHAYTGTNCDIAIPGFTIEETIAPNYPNYTIRDPQGQAIITASAVPQIAPLSIYNTNGCSGYPAAGGNDYHVLYLANNLYAGGQLLMSWVRCNPVYAQSQYRRLTFWPQLSGQNAGYVCLVP